MATAPKFRMDVDIHKRDWTLSQMYRKMRGWLFPYIRFRSCGRNW
jgi:hypothetical protein